MFPQSWPKAYVSKSYGKKTVSAGKLYFGIPMYLLPCFHMNANACTDECIICFAEKVISETCMC